VAVPTMFAVAVWTPVLSRLSEEWSWWGFGRFRSIWAGGFWIGIGAKTDFDFCYKKVGVSASPC